MSKPNTEWGPKDRATREEWEQTLTPSFKSRCLDIGYWILDICLEMGPLDVLVAFVFWFLFK